MRDLEIHGGHQFLVKLDGGKKCHAPCERAAVCIGSISPGEMQLVAGSVGM